MNVNSIGPSGGSRWPAGPEAETLAATIERKMRQGIVTEALATFKRVLTIDSRNPGFAEKVLENAPAFAAFVAKMGVDKIVAEFDLEKERARKIWKLADEYAKRTKIVPPAQPL